MKYFLALVFCSITAPLLSSAFEMAKASEGSAWLISRWPVSLVKTALAPCCESGTGVSPACPAVVTRVDDAATHCSPVAAVPAVTAVAAISERPPGVTTIPTGATGSAVPAGDGGRGAVPAVPAVSAVADDSAGAAVTAGPTVSARSAVAAVTDEPPSPAVAALPRCVGGAAAAITEQQPTVTTGGLGQGATTNAVGTVADQVYPEIFIDRVVDGFAQRAVDPVLLIGMNGLQERRVEPRCGIRRCCSALSRVACSGYGIRSGTRAGYRAGGRTNTGDRIRWQRQPLIECATA